MTVEEGAKRYMQLAGEIGRGALSSLYPNDFEVYLMSFELTKFNDIGREEVMSFFSFPILPNNISQTEPQITNIKKSFGGITTLNTNTFIPKDIQISGNFGRNFKILLNNDIADFKAISINAGEIARGIGQNIKKKYGDVMNFNTSSFDNYIKTGYGCLKILQSICDASVEIDNGRPRRLYFHNPTLGESYLVKITSFTPNQNMQQNAIWGYTLQMKAISPVQSLSQDEDRSMKDSVKVGVLQSSINKVATTISRMI